MIKNKKWTSLPKTNFQNCTTLLFCPKRFLHYKGPKIAICLWLSHDLKHCTFSLQSLIMAQQKTNCNLRTFRVKESFWAKNQSCITLKVGIKKWCLFFVFVCFSGRQFFSLSLRKSTNVFENSNPYFLTTTYPSIGKYDPFLCPIS